MKVRAKKSLGQHFLTDKAIAKAITDALSGGHALEVGPGMGVLTANLIGRTDIDFKAVELDRESIRYLRGEFPLLEGRLIEGDFLRLDLEGLFHEPFNLIGNLPYNISSQIFFKMLGARDIIPEAVCMVQREVAQRIAEKPGSKVYGILSVLLQAWYDCEYLFTVNPGSFSPPPKVKSAVIRLRRNSRKSMQCDEKLFTAIVKASFGQRRKTMRNSLRTLAVAYAERSCAEGKALPAVQEFLQQEVFGLRPEKLSVEDFIALSLSFEERFPPKENS